MASTKGRRISGYYTYVYGDSHEPPDDPAPIPSADPVTDPSRLTQLDLRELFRGNSYPYAERMHLDEYYEQKVPLQVELVKMQNWVKDANQKVIILFEGRDAAGKGGTIRRFMEHLNPRGARVVALDKPSEIERSQWYFQRYVQQFPSGGEIVLFDRSWYNRAGVERVMGFCTDKEYEQFLIDVPQLENIWTANGIRLIKLYFSVSSKEQARRFDQRESDPLKQWKLSPVDIASRSKWDEYTVAKIEMFRRTHTEVTPWTLIKADDKMRGRINAMRHVLHALPYDGKDTDVAHAADPLIVANAGGVYGTGDEIGDVAAKTGAASEV